MEQKFVSTLLEKHKDADCKTAKKTLNKSIESLKKLKSLAHGKAAKTANNRSDGYIKEWLWDNYSTLHERQLENFRQLWNNPRHVLKKIGILLCSFEEYTERILTTKEKFDLSGWIYSVNNNKIFEAGFEISRLIPVCARLCVYEKITQVFSEYFEDDIRAEVCLSKIEKLFCDANSLYEFDDEEVYLSNPGEKVLMTDEIYPHQTEKTKAFYRERTAKLSRKIGISQKKYLEMLSSKCKHGKGKRRHIGYYLLENRFVYGKIYLWLVMSLTAFFELLLFAFNPVLLLSLPCVYRSVKILLDRAFSYVGKDSFLPSLKLSEIPDKAGVMVVVTTLLTGDKREKELFERLERFYHSNGGKNVYFALLCDLVDSGGKNNENDRKIMLDAGEKIRELGRKYGSFYLFFREREYCESEDVYMAPERKRGAVSGLCEFLCGKSDVFSDFSIKPDESICKNIRYVLTLDADTNLSVDCLKTLVGIMLHPMNEPVFDRKKGVVTSGYGILQPRMSTNLDDALETSFTRVHCFERGIDSYSFAHYDGMMKLFGKGVFCGKGMFDKWAFYNTLCRDREFEKNKILSHDAPEGARLRCAVVPEVCFTDSFPKQELTYFKRLHRWVRGDVQNFVFLKKKVKNVHGEKTENGLDFVSKMFIAENLVNAFLPVSSCALILLSLVFPQKSGIFVLLSVLPYCLGWVSELFFSLYTLSSHSFTALFYSKGVYTPFFHSFMGMLYSLCAMAKCAFVSADAIVRSCYRLLVSHKNTLEWTTAAQNDREKKDGILGYVRKNLSSAFLGAVLFVFSSSGLVRSLGIMWFFYPYIAFVTSKERKRQKAKFSYGEKLVLSRYAEDMWKYFDEAANEECGFIPCDNISLYPERKKAVMTSPTNIGLYILSGVCMMCVFGRDEEEILSSLEKTAEGVKALPKYKGLLYNWYDVKKGTPMEPLYISSVDVGNFKACLIAAANMLKNQGTPRAKKLSEELEKMVFGTDTGFLYNERKNLFYIGASVCGDKVVYDKNCYDMLMSEARILSYIAIAERSVPHEHYSYLSRPVVKGKRYIGLASWSGTAFEYFLPLVFLPVKEGSLIYEACCFAYDCQKKASFKADGVKMFGISESCYNETDMAANYKYHAFGVEECALKPIETCGVISPYSSFLMLETSPKKVLQNLKNMEKAGLYGEYGFYESADFERPDKGEDFGKVKCFMSHHIGMSICAAANAVSGGIIRKSFMENKANDSAKTLLEERIPGYIAVKTKAVARFTKNLFKPSSRECIMGVKSKICRLAGEKMGLFADNKGNVCLQYDGFYINKISLYGEENGLFRAYVKIENEIFLVSKVSLPEKRPGQIILRQEINTINHGKFECALSFTLDRNTSYLARAHIRIRRLSGTSEINPRCMFVFIPVLDTKDKLKTPFFLKRTELCAVAENDGSMMNFKNTSTGLSMSVSLSDKKEMYFHCDKAFVMKCFEEDRLNTLFEKDEAEGKTGGIVCVSGKLSYVDLAYRNELFISVSENEKCAAMGIIRGEEKSFVLACEQFSEQDGNFSFRAKDVKSASVNMEEVAVETAENMPKVVFGEKCVFFPEEKSVGFTLSDNRNSALSAVYEGVFEKKSAESILFGEDDFDACKNACEREFLPDLAVYKGRYSGMEYTLKVFVNSSRCEKIFVVDTAATIPMRLRVCFDKKRWDDFEIAAGALCLEKKEGISFLFGCDGKSIARPVMIRQAEVVFDGRQSQENRKAFFVFGMCDSFEKVSERIKDVFSDVEGEYKKSAEYTEKHKIDFSKMTRCEMDVLTRNVPCLGCGYAVKPLFSDSFSDKLFFALCLTYTETKVLPSEVSEYGEKVFSKGTEQQKLVFCLLFARCVVNEESEDELKRLSAMYRNVLECVFENTEKYKSSAVSEDVEEKELLGAVLFVLERAAHKLNDTRTSITLSDEVKFFK